MTQPSEVGPGGEGQGSDVDPAVPHSGATPPMYASWEYRA